MTLFENVVQNMCQKLCCAVVHVSSDAIESVGFLFSLYFGNFPVDRKHYLISSFEELDNRKPKERMHMNPSMKAITFSQNLKALIKRLKGTKAFDCVWCFSCGKHPEIVTTHTVSTVCEWEL